MNFNSHEFLLLFLPVVLAVFHLAPPVGRIPILLISSLIFYSASGLVPLGFMVVSIFWGFTFALLSHWRKSAWMTFASIVFPFSVLYLFKYLDFTLTNALASDETRELFFFFLSVTLPAGISFYTFQIVSYNLDVRSGRIRPERNILKLATYISLFPQLIAGPILRYTEMSAQLDRLRKQVRLNVDVQSGLKFLSIGLFAKVCISDLVNVLIKNSITHDITIDATRMDVLFLLNAYSIRIFYDFWAYSLIAIGLAKLISLDLPINFREPYQSHSPREFWRRWHVTLSYWLRDYLYIRIGGNNNYVRNIVIVFLACGLWHGAGWSFVVWGALHGGGVLLYHFNRRRWDSWPAFVKISLTYALISLSWPLFFMDIDRYVTLLKVLVWSTDGAGIYTLKHWFFILPILAWMFFSKERVWLYNKKPIIIIDSPVIHSLMALIAIIFASYSDTFIYFRF